MIYFFIFLFFFAAFCSHDHLASEVVAQEIKFDSSSVMSDAWTNPLNQETQGAIRSHLRDASIETTRLQECVVNLQEKVERFKFELEDARQAEAARGDTILILQNQVKRLEAINAATLEELCTFRRKSNNAEIEIHQLKQRCLSLKEERNKLRDDLRRCTQAPAMTSFLKPEDSRIKKLETEKKLEEDRNRHLISHLEGTIYANKALIMEKEALITENLADVEKLQEETQFWKMKYKECAEKLDALERRSPPPKFNWIKAQGTIEILKQKIASVQLEKNTQLKLADDLICLNASTSPTSAEIASIIIPILQIILRRVSLLKNADCGDGMIPSEVKSKNVVHVWYLLRNILSLLCSPAPSLKKDAQSQAASELTCEVQSSHLKDISTASQQLDEMITHSSNCLPDQSMGDYQNTPKSDNLVDKILDVANISRHFSKIGTQLRNLGEMFKENSNEKSVPFAGDFEKLKSLKSESGSDKNFEDQFTDLRTVSMQLENLGKQFRSDSENVTKLSVLSQHLDKLGSHLHNLGELFSTYDVFFKSKTPGEENREACNCFKKPENSKWAPQLSSLLPVCLENGQNTSRSETTEEVDWNFNSHSKDISGFSHLIDSEVASRLDHLISDGMVDITRQYRQKENDDKAGEVVSQIKALLYGQPSKAYFPTRSTDRASLNLVSTERIDNFDCLDPSKPENALELCKDGVLPYPSWRTLLVGFWLNKSKYLGRRTVSEPSLGPKSGSMSKNNVSSIDSEKNVCNIDSDITTPTIKAPFDNLNKKREAVDHLPKEQCSIEALKHLGKKPKQVADMKKIHDLQTKLNSEKLKRFSFSLQVKKLLSELQRKLDVDVKAKRASMNQSSSIDQSLCGKKHRRRTSLDY